MSATDQSQSHLGSRYQTRSRMVARARLAAYPQNDDKSLPSPASKSEEYVFFSIRHCPYIYCKPHLGVRNYHFQVALPGPK